MGQIREFLVLGRGQGLPWTPGDDCPPSPNQARIQDFCQGRAPREWWPYMGWEWTIFDTYASTDLQLFKMFIAILCLNGVDQPFKRHQCPFFLPLRRGNPRLRRGSFRPRGGHQIDIVMVIGGALPVPHVDVAPGRGQWLRDLAPRRLVAPMWVPLGCSYWLDWFESVTCQSVFASDLVWRHAGE